VKGVPFHMTLDPQNKEI